MTNKMVVAQRELAEFKRGVMVAGELVEAYKAIRAGIKRLGDIAEIAMGQDLLREKRESIIDELALCNGWCNDETIVAAWTAANKWGEALSDKLVNEWRVAFSHIKLAASAHTNKLFSEHLMESRYARTIFMDYYHTAVSHAMKIGKGFETDVIRVRKVIAKANKARFPKVAVNKADRKAFIRSAIYSHFKSASLWRTNAKMYFYAAIARTQIRNAKYGFEMAFAIWANAIRIRAMYPRC